MTELGYFDLCESAPAVQEVPDPSPANALLTVRVTPALIDSLGFTSSQCHH